MCLTGSDRVCLTGSDRVCCYFLKVECGYQVFLECETEEVEICYTLDGSYPAEYNSKLMVRVTLCFGFPMVFRA